MKLRAKYNAIYCFFFILFVVFFILPLVTLRALMGDLDNFRRSPFGNVDTAKVTIPLRSTNTNSIYRDVFSFTNQIKDIQQFPKRWAIRRVKIPRMWYDVELGRNAVIQWQEETSPGVGQITLQAAVPDGSYSPSNLAQAIGQAMTDESTISGNLIPYSGSIVNSKMLISSGVVGVTQWRLYFDTATEDIAYLAGFNHSGYAFTGSGSDVYGTAPTMAGQRKSILIQSSALKAISRDYVCWNGATNNNIVHIVDIYTGLDFLGPDGSINTWIDEKYPDPVWHECPDGVEFKDIDIQILSDDSTPEEIIPSPTGTDVCLEIDVEVEFEGRGNKRLKIQ